MEIYLVRSLPNRICSKCRASQVQQVRSVATARRTRQVLRVPPHSSFTESVETTDHIIFNPPSSAPNVYHTPSKFLPKNDPRRKLHMLAQQQLQAAAATTAQMTAPKSRLPPPIRPPYEKKYHLTQKEIDEIRRLRAEDPHKWTRVRLAEKFDCSQFFVSLCASAPQVKEARDLELEAVKSKWGRQKQDAREERQRRKEGWGRGD